MQDYNLNHTISTLWTVIKFVVDVGIMWILFSWIIKIIRNNNRTIQIFKGITAIIILNTIAKFLNLTTLSYFLNLFINWGFLAFIVIFQPEARSILERIGKTNAKISSLLSNEKQEVINNICDAAVELSNRKTGALITIERKQSLEDYIKTGVSLNSNVTKDLLCSIFVTTTPLHDGAVIIQGDKIACASTFFPPTSVNLSSRYGSRHRAALGIAEVSDALTIVVSEETSAISISEYGKIFTVNEQQLRDYLKRTILNEQIELQSEKEKRINNNRLLIKGLDKSKKLKHIIENKQSIKQDSSEPKISETINSGVVEIHDATQGVNNEKK